MDSALVKALPARRTPIDGKSVAAATARIGGQCKRYRQASRYYDGLIDEFALFTRALSEDEIRHAYLLGHAGKSLTE